MHNWNALIVSFNEDESTLFWENVAYKSTTLCLGTPYGHFLVGDDWSVATYL